MEHILATSSRPCVDIEWRLGEGEEKDAYSSAWGWDGELRGWWQLMFWLRRGGRIPVVTPRLAHRLGNHVFQYFAARLIAHHLNLTFSSPRLGGPYKALSTFERPRKQFRRKEGGGTVHQIRWLAPSWVIEEEEDEIVRRVGELSGMCFAVEPLRRMVEEGRMVVEVFDEDEEEEEHIMRWMRVCIGGFAQDRKLFEEYSGELVRSWLDPCFEEEGGVSVGKGGWAVEVDGIGWEAVRSPTRFELRNSWVIHVRLGDILSGVHSAYRPLPLSYYRSAMACLPNTPSTIVLVADTKRSANPSTPAQHVLSTLADTFSAPGVRVVCQSLSMREDLLTLSRAPVLILSLSTFAWWPAMTTKYKRTVVYPEWGVFAPCTVHFSSSLHADQDLRLGSLDTTSSSTPSPSSPSSSSSSSTTTSFDDISSIPTVRIPLSLATWKGPSDIPSLWDVPVLWDLQHSEVRTRSNSNRVRRNPRRTSRKV